jgi:folate-binding protein YgfZ
MTPSGHYARLLDRAVLRIGGADRVTFLQGLLTNDVPAISPSHGQYAALLTPQGKFLADFLITEHDDAFLLDTHRDTAESTLKRFMLYKLRAQVTLEDVTARYAVLALWNGAAPPPAGDAAAFTDPRDARLGLRLYAPETALDGLRAAGYTPADAEAYERHRLHLGIPEGGKDLLANDAFILDYGFEPLHGVSFSKGCYVGQEVTARMKYRAQQRKQLYIARANTAASWPGHSFVVHGANGVKIGETLSGLPGLGLCLLRKEDAEPLHAAGSPVTIADNTYTLAMPDWASAAFPLPG